jgi:hypothetical protein
VVDRGAAGVAVEELKAEIKFQLTQRLRDGRLRDGKSV